MREYELMTWHGYCSVEEIIEALRGEESGWGQNTLHSMLKMSPTSLKVGLLLLLQRRPL